MLFGTFSNHRPLANLREIFQDLMDQAVKIHKMNVNEKAVVMLSSVGRHLEVFHMFLWGGNSGKVGDVHLPGPSKGCQMVPKGCQFSIP